MPLSHRLHFERPMLMKLIIAIVQSDKLKDVIQALRNVNAGKIKETI